MHAQRTESRLHNSNSLACMPGPKICHQSLISSVIYFVLNQRLIPGSYQLAHSVFSIQSKYFHNMITKPKTIREQCTALCSLGGGGISHYSKIENTFSPIYREFMFQRSIHNLKPTLVRTASSCQHWTIMSLQKHWKRTYSITLRQEC